MNKYLLFVATLQLVFASNNYPAYQYDCMGCLLNGHQYCAYSGTYNTGNCDDDFFWCTDVWTSSDMNSCKNDFKNRTSDVILGNF